MKIGIISDTHGVVSAWQKAMRLFAGADMILHAGDVLYHPPRIGFTGGYDIPELAQIMNECPIPIIIARGNCDSDVYEELLRMPVSSPYAVAQLGRFRAVVTHGQTLDEGDFAGLAERYAADILVTGHTHIPVIEQAGCAIHINPGSPAHPKYERNRRLLPTVGLLTDEKVQILALETGEEIMVRDLGKRPA
jgi:uncharacterized protein